MIGRASLLSHGTLVMSGGRYQAKKGSFSSVLPMSMLI